MSDEKIVQNGAVGGEKKRKHGPGHLLVGKIARLPKAIREMLNRRLDDGVPASTLVPWLNELPPVQTVLASYFGGAAITQKNISNWSLTGFKRWQERQEVLAEVRELSEEAADINETNPDGLMRMTATLACTKLLRGLRDAQSGIDVTKAAFAIAALNNVELSHVRVQHEEQRLTQKDTLVELAWDKHFRDCASIGHRLMGDWKAKEIHEADIDYSDQIELLGRHMFGDLWRRRRLPGEDEIIEDLENAERKKRETGSTCGPDEKTPENTEQEETETTERADIPSPHPDPLPSRPTGAERGQQADDVHDSKSQQHVSVAREGTDGTDETEAGKREDLEGPLAHARGSVTTPANPYTGKTTQQLIAEAEDNYAGEKARRLNSRRRKNETGETPIPLSETKQKPQAPKREMSAYEKALLEGKTHLEALYAQFAPMPKPKDDTQNESQHPKPGAWGNGVCEPVHYAPGPTELLSGPVEPPLSRSSGHNFRPPPGWNSLG